MTWAAEYSSEHAFWAALRARASRQAKAQRQQPQEVLRQFIIARFMARVFQVPSEAPWVVAGGTGMLIRIPGARTTRDLDLTSLHARSGRRSDIVAALSPYLGPGDLDPFSFAVTGDKPFTGPIAGIKFQVTATIGADRAAFFGLDVANDDVAISDVDLHRPEPVIDGIRGLSPLPVVPLFPLASQIADKVIGVMYRDERGRSAGRYRDLVDLALYGGRVDIHAGSLRHALHSRARLRKQPTPQHFTIPDDWARGYRRVASSTVLPAPAHEVANAGEAVGSWLTPLLVGDVPDHFAWDHTASAWHDLSYPASRPGKVWVRSHLRSGVPVIDYFRSRPAGRGVSDSAR